MRNTVFFIVHIYNLTGDLLRSHVMFCQATDTDHINHADAIARDIYPIDHESGQYISVRQVTPENIDTGPIIQ